MEKLGKRVAAREVKEEFKGEGLRLLQEKLRRGYAQLVSGKWSTEGVGFASSSTTSG